MNKKIIISICAPAVLCIYIISGNANSSLKAWRASWFGSGGDSKTFFSGNNNVPVTEKENAELDKRHLGSKVFFVNSDAKNKDSIIIHYIHEGGKGLDGKWGWVSFTLAPNEMWTTTDVSSYNAIILNIKAGDLGNKKVVMQLRSKSRGKEKQTKGTLINDFLKAGRMTNAWQKITIPFEKIDGIKNIDLKNLSNIGFNFQTPGEHIIYFDNIIFIK